MKKIKVNGMTHIDPESNEKHPWLLNEIKCSPFALSETRYITAVPEVIKQKLNDISIVLVDTPGFDDTSGAEVDIANGKGIIDAIGATKSVRLVLFISKTDVGARLQGIRHLLKIVTDMLPNMKDRLESFNYVFTRYDEDDRTNINPTLVELYHSLKNSEETENQALLVLVEDMVCKTEDDRDIMIINLLDEKKS